MFRNTAYPAFSRWRALVCAALLLACLAPLSGAMAAGKGSSAGRLSAEKYYTFDPFTIPLLTNGIVREQFVLVIAVELREAGQRDDIAGIVPRVRDAMYKELFRMVTFRRAGHDIPTVEMFKRRLFRIARQQVGDEFVAALLVQQAYKRTAR
jgi:hypothetical protein